MKKKKRKANTTFLKLLRNFKFIINLNIIRPLGHYDSNFEWPDSNYTGNIIHSLKEKSNCKKKKNEVDFKRNLWTKFTQTKWTVITRNPSDLNRIN